VRVEPRLATELAAMTGQEVGLYAEGERWILGTDTEEVLYMGPALDLGRALRGARVYVTSFKNVLEQGRLDLPCCAEVFDIELAAYLLSPEERNYSLDRIRDGLGEEVDVHRENHGQATLAVGRLLHARLAGSELLGLLQNLEQPLTEVLVRMQKRGIRIDEAKFRDFLSMVQAELDRLTLRIHARPEGNSTSAPASSWGRCFFPDWGCPANRRPRAGRSPRPAACLRDLAEEHPIVADILEFRMYEKLRSTYLEPLPQLADKDGRIHTTFNQLATATGRLSSSNPNLQNIPIRGALGPRMRSCFVPAPGNSARGRGLFADRAAGPGAHVRGSGPCWTPLPPATTSTRARPRSCFDKAEVSPDERRKAKTINFGLLYGMGPQKLGRELGISLKEAKEFIAVYFSKLSRVREFYEEIEAGPSPWAM
jgi:DNA polymerase I